MKWVKSLSRVRLFATPWTVAYQAPPTMGFSRQEYWSGLPFPSPGDLPNSGIEPGSPALQTLYRLSHQGSPLCDPMDCSPPGFSTHGIFQAWVLEWVAISFSRGSSLPRDWTWVSHIAGRCFTIWATRESKGILGTVQEYNNKNRFSWGGIGSKFTCGSLDDNI